MNKILLIHSKYCIFFVVFFSALNTFSQKKYNQEIQLQQDNDVLTFKRRVADRYYSFGMHFDYRKVINEDAKLAVFANKHIKNLNKVIVNWHVGIEGYTSDLHRDKKIKQDSIQFDRPYAGWTFLSNKIVAVNSTNIYYIKTTLGVLGPNSGAEKLQDNFHKAIGSPEFVEWDNQIQNEIAGNIELGLNHTLLKKNKIDFYSETSLSLGFQSTFFKQGILARIGLINPINETVLYHTNLTNKENPSKNELFLHIGAHAIIWGYKATIQGRFFGENENMNTDGLNRVNADLSAGIIYARPKISFFFKHHLITAETSRGRHFYYGELGFTVKI